MAKRRHRGEGGSYRVCAAAHGCPDPIDVVGPGGKAQRRRPEHGKYCKAPWAYSVDGGIVAGRRVRHVVTAKSKADLLAKVETLKAKLAHGVSPTATTVGDWLDYWVTQIAPAKDRRPTTLTGYRSKIELYLKPAVGRVQLQSLTPEHVAAMHAWMRTLDKSRIKGSHGAGPLSETTIRQAHMVLRSALAAAVTWRKIIYNPAEITPAPRAEENPHEHLRLDDAKAVLRSATTTRELCRCVVALALGLRQGEALGLRWADLRDDADGRYLHVEEAVQRVDGRLVRTDVKSKASRRRIPIPERMVPIFTAWHAEASDPYIFPGPNGGPCDSKADWAAWRASLARAGVPLIPLHGARGSAASLLADMGVPDWRIAEILGHSQVTTTRRHYIEGTGASHRKAIEGLIGELLP